MLDMRIRICIIDGELSRATNNVFKRLTKTEFDYQKAFQGLPKWSPKCIISEQNLIQTSPERLLEINPEKSHSWALLGSSPCGSCTVPAMLLTHSTRWFQLILFFTLGLNLASFLHPWAPKWCTGTEKEALRKHIKKHLHKCLEMSSRTEVP